MMKIKLESEDFSERQITILKLLFEKEYQQKELQELLVTSAPNLHYHLSRLEELDLVQKKTLYQVGNVKVNEISLNPAARQQVRHILGHIVEDFTLITGFGLLRTGYRVPDEIFKLLKQKYYPISKVICFTSPDALKKREENQEAESLIKIDKFYLYEYEEYRNIISDFFKNVEQIISSEMKTADIIIDLTPLSKLYSLKLLEISNKYQIPCIYCAIDDKGKYQLLSLSDMKIEGKFNHFK